METVGTNSARYRKVIGLTASPGSDLWALEANRTHVWLGVVFVTVVYAAVIHFTKPITWGDTIVYAPQVVNFSKGLLDRRQFWEFGHLFWRPIGYLIWHLGQPYWSRQVGGSQVLEVYGALRLPNLLLGYVAALASFGIARRISRSVLVGAIVAGAFLGWNPFVNYVQSGTAYVPGLAMQLSGLYLLLGDSSGKRSRWRAWSGGMLLALSVCLWFPYLFGLPGVFFLAYLWGRTDPAWNSNESRTRLRWLAHAILACALIGVLSYGVGMSLAGVKSVEQLKTWVADAGHGVQPERKYLRVATGLPRGLVEIGQQGLVLKRFVTKDPYDPVTVYDLLRSGLWKVLLFYAGIAGLIWTLVRDPDARAVSLPFFVSGALVLFLAVVLFEPSQSERWMPAFAVLLPAIAFVLRGGKALRISVIPLAILLVAAWVSNFAAHATPSEPGPENPAVARILEVKPLLVPHSIVTLLSFRDGISDFLARFPFHPLNPLNGTKAMRFYFLTEPGSANSARWARSFAGRGLQAWQEGGDIWISKRMIAARPLPEWGWVEGDDPHLHWSDISEFFTACTFDSDVGGADGFLRIARVPTNQALLEATVRNRGEIH